MKKIYAGISLLFFSVIVNYSDELLPEFSSITFFGTTFSMIEGYSSADMLWGINQKVEIVIIAMAALLFYYGAFGMASKRPPLKQTRVLVFSVLTVSLFQTYLAINIIVDWFVGLDRDFMLATIMFILLCVVAFIAAIYFYRKHSLKIQKRIIKRAIEEKTDFITIELMSLTKELEVFEEIANEMHQEDDILPWKVGIKSKARAIYDSADVFLKKVEK